MGNVCGNIWSYMEPGGIYGPDSNTTQPSANYLDHSSPVGSGPKGVALVGIILIAAREAVSAFCQDARPLSQIFTHENVCIPELRELDGHQGQASPRPQRIPPDPPSCLLPSKAHLWGEGHVWHLRSSGKQAGNRGAAPVSSEASKAVRGRLP